MKTTYKYMLLAGLVVLAAGCAKEIEKESPADATTGKMITETISAQIEGETKATVDANAKFAWTAGDNIAVHVSKGDSHAYVTTTSGASAAASSASFSVSYGEGYSRDAFAIFPSTIVATDAANYGQSGSSLDVTLPASYTLTQVSDEATPCPMIAANTPGAGWTFSQLCGLLRLTVNSIPSDATGIVIQFPGKKVNGNFSIASPVTPGSSTIATGVPASGGDQITVTFDAGTTSATINLPLPTGDYDDVFITPVFPVDSDNKVAAVRHIGYTAQAAHGKKLTTTLVSFSVAANKKVVFAPGNLQAIIASYDDETKLATASSWKFADTQYSTVVDLGPEDKSFTMSFAAGKTVDLFTYQGTSSTAPAHYGLCTLNPKTADEQSTSIAYHGNADVEGLKADWGTLAIGSYATNTWATPSSPEFNYLFTERTGASTVGTTENARWAKVSICDHYGLLIFPDVYTHPEGVTVPNAINQSLDRWEAVTKYDSSAWTKIEAAGAVFLPVGGKRSSGTNVTVGSTAGVNKVAIYMTSTSTTKNSTTLEGKYKGLRFQGQDANTNFDGGGGDKRHNGGSVRLYHVL